MSSPPLEKAGGLSSVLDRLQTELSAMDLGRSQRTLVGMNEPGASLAFWREEDCNEKYGGR
jgi:hypothetical protein